MYTMKIKSKVSALALIGSLFVAFNLQAATLKNNTGLNQVTIHSDSVTKRKLLEYAPNQLLVQYKTKQTIKNRFMQTQSMTVSNSIIATMNTGEEIAVVKINQSTDLKTAMAAYKSDPNVLAVSYNYYRELYFSPNDTKYVGDANLGIPNVMWGLHDTAPDLTPFVGNLRANSNDPVTGDDIKAELAWDVWNTVSAVDKANVVVAVIDSGVDYTHPDLVDAMWDGSNATVAGVASPTSKHGRNVADNVNDPYPTTSSHGTHVAGTIAATMNNGIGIPGVASGVKIMAVQVSSEMDDFILDASLISGINYAVENGADIINMSLGGGGAEDLVLTSAMKNAVDAGVLLVVAAGNRNEDNDIFNAWPANYAKHPLTKAGVISVAATDQADLKADFSSYGANSVTLGAPGVNIESTIRGLEELPENKGYGQLVTLGSGTGVGNIPLCTAQPNTCFSNTIFSNPAGKDCTGTNCSWGWKKEVGVLRNNQGQLMQTLVLYADGNANTAIQYGASINGTITSKIINTAGKKAILKYEASWDLECGNGNSDYVDVEVFDGTSWILLKRDTILNLNTPIFVLGDLNLCTSTHSITGHMALFPVGAENPPIGFFSIHHDLSKYSNANMRVRFTFVTNATVNSTTVKSGFQMQNVRVQTQVSDYTSSYAFFSGTSMSSPHVAGIAALIKGVNPTFTGAQIKTALVNGADANTAMTGKTISGTRANAFNPINTPIGPTIPNLSPIGGKTVVAGQLIEFVVTATDANKTIPTLEITGKPANATFTLSSPNDGTATFSWTPLDTDVGNSVIKFIARDSDPATPGSVSQTITITVNPLVASKAPVLFPIGNKSVIAGKTLKFDVRATDENSTIPVLTLTGKPANATFIIANDGSAVFKWTPAESDVGTATITFTATDSDATTPGTDSEKMNITVSTAITGGGNNNGGTNNNNNNANAGCTLNQSAKFDPIFPGLLFLLSLLYFGRKQKKQ